ncbi:lipase family protein [Aquiflexum lacus]|uniref:lipase family protein n=1 Tax=Aquiflexum lacus TaxID=2483805 RepID=UPI001895E8B8|nr:lipase family protein [Aquiflexum lacus]
MRTIFSIIIFLLPISKIFAQNLQPSFEVLEYLELMKISTRATGDSSYYNQFPEPENHILVYQSPEMGLKNRWDLWIAEHQKSAVISIRGTTADPVSWLENFYAGMVPATGKLHLSDDFQFEYQLAEDQKAAVHIGWLVGTAFLSRDILPKLDSLYQKGIKDFLIIGHSQGGGIAYLLTSHLNFLQKQQKIPGDIRWKTYCSAAPKPGNLHYAYDFESLASEGWAYNVVNASDWVPQVPFSIQTIDDFNEVNPFKDAKKVIKNQKFPDRIVMRRVFNQLDKPTRKAQRNFQKYLGDKASTIIKRSLPEFRKPEFIASSLYVRTGNTIVLLADDQYREKYPDNSKTVFMHHLHQPYIDLAERKYLEKP